MSHSNKAKVILNASPLVVGGALQACVSFIQKALLDKTEIDWRFIVSKEVNEQLRLLGIEIKGSQGFVLENSPAKSKLTRRKVKDLADKIDPDAIFTFFGPAYVSLQHPHLMGVADGWITHSSGLALSTRKGIIEWMKFAFLFLYKRHWYKKADNWVVEAECARQGMNKRFFTPLENIYTVSNSCSDSYKINRRSDAGLNAKVRLLTLSSYYRHKNLEIIPDVAAAITRLSPSLEFEFVITIPKGSVEEARLFARAKELEVLDALVNIGPVPVKDGPALYQSCDITFMPSLLETFSAVYPEAMMSGHPIVTSDLDFARDICGPAALYFDPKDAHKAAKEIVALIESENKFASLVALGRKRVDDFPDQDEKYQLYVNILKEMIKKAAFKQ